MMHDMIDRFARPELLMLLAVLVIVGGTWGFIELADEVNEQETQQFDEAIILALRQPDNRAVPVGPRWLHEVGRDITALGGLAVLSIMTAAVAGFLAIRRQYHAVIFVIVATVGGQLISSSLKWLVDRPRPDLVPHLSIVYTSSFPSGHSMMAAVVYLTLGALLARFVSQWRLRLYFLVLAMLLTMLVGVSRVYMGVHYPTDVLAGWTAGLVWATLCWLVARYLQQRGAVEADVDAKP